MPSKKKKKISGKKSSKTTKKNTKKNVSSPRHAKKPPKIQKKTSTKLPKKTAKLKSSKTKTKQIPSLKVSADAIRKLKGKNKKFFELLMKARAILSGDIEYLSQEALKTGSTVGDHTSIMTNHIADYGSDSFLHGMELDVLAEETNEIEIIDEAIQRLISGEYGKCLDCGCKIPEPRLLTRPHANFCVKCQEKLEKESES
jgi:DnaK suppressor protein